MRLSYQKVKMLMEMVRIGIKNGTSAEAEVFDPTTEQYRMLCRVAKEGKEYIEQMQKNYGL